MGTDAMSCTPGDPGPGETTVLVRRVGFGDRGAKAALYERLREPVLARICAHRLFARLRRWMSAEDLLGDVLERCEVTRAFEGFEETGPRSVRRFLATVVHCTLVDAQRRRMAATRGGGWRQLGGRGGDGDDRGDDLDRLPAGGATPTAAARAAELIARIRRTLGERDWEAWRLRELEVLDADEIAAQQRTTRSLESTLLAAPRPMPELPTGTLLGDFTLLGRSVRAA